MTLLFSSFSCTLKFPNRKKMITRSVQVHKPKDAGNPSGSEKKECKADPCNGTGSGDWKN